MDEIVIKKNDVLERFKFICCMAQKNGDKTMYGTLNGKGDYIGGIFDRFINTIPEDVVFNKIILKDLIPNKTIKCIRDFYSYDPKKGSAGIAPDLIGIDVDGKIIPYKLFDEKWISNKKINAPEIEVKTFKKGQTMVSLRNQNYDGEYLVIVESNFRVDYLIPFFDKKLLDIDLYKGIDELNKCFILNNAMHSLAKFNCVTNFDEIGTIKLLKVTKASDFMKNAVFCDKGVSVVRVKTIEQYDGIQIKYDKTNYSLSKYVDKLKNGLYRYNSSWYDDKVKEGIYLDFECNNIDDLLLVKKNKTKIYLYAKSDNVTFNNMKLKNGIIYSVTYESLQRSNSKNPEYFIQKELIDNCLPDCYDELREEIKKTVEV